jgi:MFS family permease
VQQEEDEQAAGGALAQEQREGDGSRSERHHPYEVLRNRDLMLYTLARNIALIGQQITTVGIGWELYSRTHDALALGYVGLVQFVPVLLLAIPAGHAADRFGRKEIVQAAQVLLALSALGLAAVSALRGPVSLVYLCLLFAGLARGFSGPARSAMLPQFVPQEEYESAIKWNTSVFQVASMLGPALGGAVIAAGHGAAPAYLLDAACGTTAFLLTALAVTRYGSPRAPAAPMTLESLTAGLRFVWRTRIILATITLDLFAVLFGGAVALLPIYAQDVLHVGPRGLGWLQAAPAAGAFCMAVTQTHLPPLRRPGAAMLWAVGGFGAATIVFGLSRSLALSLGMLFLTGALDNISVVVRSTLVQVLTPGEMLGRVSAVNNVFISSSNQLGGFESGLVARLLGPVVSVVAGGIGTLIVVAAVALGWPETLRFSFEKDGAPPGERGL